MLLPDWLLGGLVHPGLEYLVQPVVKWNVSKHIDIGTVKGDAAALAPLQVLVHGAGLGHEDLDLAEARVSASHHRMQLRDRNHISHL